MKQSSRSAVQAELDMKEQEEREEAAERAAEEASYTEFERTGFVGESLFDLWDSQREAEAALRLETIEGRDEFGVKFKSKSDYLFAIRDLGWLSREEQEIYEKVLGEYRDQELLASFDVFSH